MTDPGKVSPAQAHFNPRVYALVCCGVAVALLVITLVPLPSLAGPVPVQPVAPLRTIPDTDVNPFGGNFFLDWEVEPWKVDKTLQMAKEAGLGWVNVHFVWEGLETKKGHFWDDRLNKSTWDKYDYIVQVAEKYSLNIIARVDRPPDWTRQDNRLKERPPDNLDDYGDFVQAVAARYKGRIGHFQVWNEPNIYPEWGDRAVDPAGYVRLLKVAYERVKKANPYAKVLSAPLAQTTEAGSRNLNEFDFLDAMYQSGAKDYFDILYANGYGFDLPPEDPPNPNKLNFARVQLLRQVMERYGDTHKAVWFHEFGWNASPESMSPAKLVWRRVTEQQQAEYTVRAIRIARRDWQWAGVFSIWYFRQDGHITPDQSEYYFRMVDPGFTPRIIYTAVANETKGIDVAGPGDYQASNPALSADRNWHEQRPPSGPQQLATEQPGAILTVKFSGTEFALVAKKQPEVARLLVTIDGRASNLLPSSGEDRSYLDLQGETSQPAVVVPVASGLTNGLHVVRIVAIGRDPGDKFRAVIEGFRVGVSGQTSSLTYGLIAAVVVTALLAVAAFWRRRNGRAEA